MEKFRSIFGRMKPTIIGMVHVGALPGTPKCNGTIEELVENACLEAEMYKSASVDSVMIENMHDIPYLQAQHHGPEVVAAMTKLCSEIKSVLPKDMPVGIQVLAGGNKEAVAIAHCCGLNYIRAEGFVFSHVADEGVFDACAGELLRYRRTIGADKVLIFTDIKKKHSSHAITADLDIKEVAKAAEFFLSDGVIITGSSTGDPADSKQVEDVKCSVGIPVLVGSGVTPDNIERYLMADGLIVGSYFKEGAVWNNKLSKEKLARFMDRITSLR